MEKTGLVILLLLAHSTLQSGVSRGYHYVQLAKTWEEAQTYCREHFIDLATIETEEDWAKVRSLVDDTNLWAWIGLYDDLDGWKWSIDNTLLYGDGSPEYGEWFDFQRDNYFGVERCVEVIGQILNDRNCLEEIKSVCYDKRTNTYIPVEDNRSWFSAQSNCRAKYTDLASVRSKEEMQAIQSVIYRSYWWIGLSRENLTWSDQSNSSLRLWNALEPSNPGVENCVCAHPTGWADADCNLKKTFICSVPTMKLFKVTLRVDRLGDMNDQLVEEAFLNHVEKHMKGHGIQKKFKLRWRKPNGKIFHKKRA